MDTFGVFSILIATVSILSKIVDFGVEPIVFRELSKDKKDFKLFNTALTIRITLFLTLIIFFNTITGYLQFSSKEIVLINLLFLTIIFSSKMVVIRELLSTPFKAILEMHIPILLTIIDQVVLLILVGLMYFLKEGLTFFVIIYTLSNLPGFILLLYLLKKKFQYKFHFSLVNVNWLVKQSLPMFGFVLLIALFQQIDLLFLKYLKGATDAGIYSASLRLTMPLSIIPTAIMTTVFPMLVTKMSNQWSSSEIMNFVFKILFAIAFIFASIFTFKSNEIVNLVWGSNYLASTLPTTILFWMQIFLFINFFAIMTLIIHNKQYYNFLYSAILVAINISLNFILIPQYNSLGAALAKLISGLIGSIFIIIILSKFNINFSLKKTKVLVWLLIILVLFYLSSTILPLLFYLILSPFIIIIATYFSQYFIKKELFVFFRLINKEELGKKLLKLNY